MAARTLHVADPTCLAIVARSPHSSWITSGYLAPAIAPSRSSRSSVTVDGAIAVIVVGRIRAISHEPRQQPELHRSASVTIINRRREHRPPNTPARGTRPSMPYVGEPGTGNVLSGHALKLKGNAVYLTLTTTLPFARPFSR